MPSSKELTAKRILEAVRQVIPVGHGPVALHEPEFGGNEWRYLKECIDTGWVSSVGKFVDRFEKMLSDYTGAAHAIPTVNGTAALHVALLLAGVKPDDEVLIPALTFVATANAVAYCRATPHLVDSAYDTLGIDPEALDQYLRDISEPNGASLINRFTGKTIRAVVPMHTFGHPVDMDGLCEVCRKYSLVIVEDAAESLGSTYKGKHTGRFGRISTLSFNGNKIVTTGGGGAILTDNPEVARRAKHITTTARAPHQWAISHDEIGFNYRMPNLNAALGCAQLEALPGFIDRKRQLAKRYEDAFAGIEDATFVFEPVGTKSNYWLNSILLSKEAAYSRDYALEYLNDAGIMARPCWTLMHRLPMYKDSPRAPLPVAEDIEGRLINLPSSANLA